MLCNNNTNKMGRVIVSNRSGVKVILAQVKNNPFNFLPYLFVSQIEVPEQQRGHLDRIRIAMGITGQCYIVGLTACSTIKSH